MERKEDRQTERERKKGKGWNMKGVEQGRGRGGDDSGEEWEEGEMG